MQVWQVIFSGVAQGCIYGLIALGFVLIYKATETVTFAQGELMMLGAFAGLACVSYLGWPFALAVVVSMGVMASSCPEPSWRSRGPARFPFCPNQPKAAPCDPFP